jgi:hypothetical protein
LYNATIAHRVDYEKEEPVNESIRKKVFEKKRR